MTLDLTRLIVIEEMDRIDPDTDWQSISRKAFWDRHVSLDVWRERVKLGRNSYFPQSVEFLSASEFAAFYGQAAFKSDWPRLRNLVPKKIAVKRLGLYDCLWSLLVTGTIYLRPWAGFGTMPRRQREFMIEVARTPGACTYEIGKRLKMQYRRAYDYRSQLYADGRIQQKEVMVGARRKIALYPGYGHTPHTQIRPEVDVANVPLSQTGRDTTHPNTSRGRRGPA